MNAPAVPATKKAQQAQAAKIYMKFTKGESLTDHEVVWGSTFYRNLADQLVQCGPDFALAFKEANRVGWALENFKTARNI